MPFPQVGRAMGPPVRSFPGKVLAYNANKGQATFKHKYQGQIVTWDLPGNKYLKHFLLQGQYTVQVAPQRAAA